jgi:hypothetical protein
MLMLQMPRNNYLANRSQHVRVGSSKSPPSVCEHGVPQGSVLGPILFSLYVAPVANVISAFNVSHHQYADDTQLYIALDHDDPGDTRNLSPCAAAVCHWFLLNGLCLNPNKSEAILLGTPSATRHSDNPVTVNIAGAIIPVSPTLKSLGVTFDSQLSFNQHVNSVCKISYFISAPCAMFDLAFRHSSYGQSPAASSVPNSTIVTPSSTAPHTETSTSYNWFKIRSLDSSPAQENLTTSLQSWLNSTGYQSHTG